MKVWILAQYFCMNALISKPSFVDCLFPSFLMSPYEFGLFICSIVGLFVSGTFQILLGYSLHNFLLKIFVVFSFWAVAQGVSPGNTSAGALLIGCSVVTSSSSGVALFESGKQAASLPKTQCLHLCFSDCLLFQTFSYISNITLPFTWSMCLTYT